MTRLRQAAAVPLRAGQVLLVTSRYTGEWLLPKGGVERGETAAEAAAREAEEEAGVRGVVGVHLGRFSFRRGDVPAEMDAFLLHVEVELKRWPEMFQRRRRWIELSAAPVEIRRPVIQEILAAAIQAVQP